MMKMFMAYSCLSIFWDYYNRNVVWERTYHFLNIPRQSAKHKYSERLAMFKIHMLIYSRIMIYRKNRLRKLNQNIA